MQKTAKQIRQRCVQTDMQLADGGKLQTTRTQNMIFVTIGGASGNYVQRITKSDGKSVATLSPKGKPPNRLAQKLSFATELNIHSA